VALCPIFQWELKARSQIRDLTHLMWHNLPHPSCISCILSPFSPCLEPVQILCHSQCHTVWDCFTPNAAATKRRCLRRKGVRQYGEERMRSFVQISLSIPTAAWARKNLGGMPSVTFNGGRASQRTLLTTSILSWLVLLY
jgi:hypothetical protein